MFLAEGSGKQGASRAGMGVLGGGTPSREVGVDSLSGYCLLLLQFPAEYVSRPPEGLVGIRGLASPPLRSAKTGGGLDGLWLFPGSSARRASLACPRRGLMPETAGLSCVRHVLFCGLALWS